MNTIFYVGGNKGGVGKTLVSLALIDYLYERYNKVDVIETDTANAEIKRIYSACPDPKITVTQIDLDMIDGWINLLNLISTSSAKYPIVINTAARNHTGVQKSGAVFRDSLAEINRKMIALWVINRQRDALFLLTQFQSIFHNIPIHVVRNTYFGEEHKFEIFNNSELRHKLEEELGYPSLSFPDLADRVSDDIYSNYISISKGLATMPLGNKAELKRWKYLCADMFDKIIHITKT
jgi:hypothetical protein